MEFTRKVEPTWWAKIYIAGDLDTAHDLCAEYCDQKGLCVTLEPCEYIYTGGHEDGYCVGLINYPKFPKSNEEITYIAQTLAEYLRANTGQMSYTVMTPEFTYWYSAKENK